MLKPQDIEIQVARCDGGKNSMLVIHKPTGIRRSKGSPLPKPGKAQYEMLREIEAELIQKGLTQHLLPDKNPKR